MCRYIPSSRTPEQNCCAREHRRGSHLARSARVISGMNLAQAPPREITDALASEIPVQLAIFAALRRTKYSSIESMHRPIPCKCRISMPAYLTGPSGLRTIALPRRAVSSAGRALLSHGRGHRFEPCTAHQPFPRYIYRETPGQRPRTPLIPEGVSRGLPAGSAPRL